jgi:hypothetical protein
LLPPLIDPSLELRSIRHIKALEQIPPVELQRCLSVPPVQRVLERHHVTPELALRQRDLIVAPGRHRALAEEASQTIERLPHGATGPILVELPPKQSDQGVPAMEAAGTGGQEREESEQFRSGQDGVRVGALGPFELGRPERPELNHRSPGQKVIVA